jgi:CubicO group peptidase (beta-lactamase class C family)
LCYTVAVPSGLHANPQSDVTTFLKSRIAAGDFPSAVYCIAENGDAVFADAIGDASREPESHPATLETVYDLASLTKPLVTGLLCARMIETGALHPDDFVSTHLAEFGREDKRSITVRHLVTHTSGLPAWRPLYLLADDPNDALEAIAEQPLDYKPGEHVIYSDLGFVALGFLLQRIASCTLVELATKEIFEPLTLKHTFFNPHAAIRTGIAACENGNAYERDMCERDFTETKYPGWRNEVIWGEVHDGNAHFLGGAAGHAGLFSTVDETQRIANQFVGTSSELLSPQTCEMFRRNMTEGLNEARSFAWQLAATKDSSAGPSLPPDAFGHTGFTGTSCWIDAERKRVFILLTNRTHARKLPFANINAVRREFHTLAVAALNNQ